MDIAVLVTFLSPFLPQLLKIGGQAAEKITEVVSEKAGDAAWAKATKIWQRLYPSIESKDDLNVATQQVAAKPDSKARQAVFQEELETLLQNQPELMVAIAQIMTEEASGDTDKIQQTIGSVDGQVIGEMKGGKNTTIDSVEGQVVGEMSGGENNANKTIGEVSGSVKGGINL
ncbi:MAG: hypothetical protein VKJ64_21270 [Leptolyngbyaceae bacterium]|nr:hypothetical protein [Leptolyngbyaceae bacterium]